MGCPELRFPLVSQFLQTNDGIISRSSLHRFLLNPLPFIIHLPVYYSTPCNLATSKITVVLWISRYAIKLRLQLKMGCADPGCNVNVSWRLKSYGVSFASDGRTEVLYSWWHVEQSSAILLDSCWRAVCASGTHRVWNNYISKRLQALMACHK